MSRARRSPRFLLLWLALVPLLSACQSTPAADVSISPESSLLAVDVLFPAPLSRDPSLVQVFFVKGPIHGGLQQLPELIPASFVKWSRAYLVDPEPGTYSLVAVTSAFAPPWNDYPVAGVSQTRWSGTSADAMIFPAEWIQRTRTTIAPGGVAFMGALRVRQGDRINASALFQDDLQQRIAERIRPGVTSESGLAGWLKRTWTVDLEETSLSNEAGDRESFVEAALADLGDSPSARVIARAVSRQDTVAKSRAPAPRPTSTLAIPEASAAKPQSAAPSPRSATAEPRSAAPGPKSAAPQPQSAALDPKAATAEPEAAPPTPERRRIPGLPPDSPLAKIELGMDHEEVRRILGPPDGRLDRTTSKAWIPFYTGPGVYLRDWIYEGEGRVIFSMYHGTLEVLDVVYDPHEKR